MKKILISSAVAMLLLAGCGEDKKTASNTANEVQKESKSAVDMVKDAAKDVSDTVTKAASDVKDTVVDTTSKVVDKTKEVVKDTSEAVTDAVEKTVEKTKEVASEVKEETSSAVSKIAEKTNDAVEEVKDTTSNVVDKTKEVANEVKEETSNAIDKTKEVAAGATAAVVGAAAIASEKTKEVTKETTDAVKNVVSAVTCEEKFKYDFTFYGAPDKSYVVTKNTFKVSKSNFPNGKLLNATLNIDATTLDTSADLSNGTAQWPVAMAVVRNNNTVNNFFKKFDTDAGKIDVKVLKVSDNSMDLEVKMNGVTKVIPFSYKVEGDLIKANGKIDVLAFNTEKAWTQFAAVCKGFHRGKSWSEVDVNFEVPASCK